MAYWKTILKGAIGSDEKWSTSITWGIFGINTDVPDQALTDDMLARLLASALPGNFPASLRLLLSSNASITGWRVEKRGEDERILSLAEGSVGSPILGTVGATKTPQDACVFSLRSSTPGARGRGRMYWPALGAVLTTSFALSTPLASLVATEAKGWIGSIGNTLNAAYIAAGSAQRVVLSVRSVTDHVCRDITQIQVGSILDTQRRRRGDFRETYASVTYP